MSPSFARANGSGRVSGSRLAIAIALVLVVVAGIVLAARAQSGDGGEDAAAGATTQPAFTGAMPLVVEPVPEARRLQGQARLEATRTAAQARTDDVPAQLALAAQELGAGDVEAARAAVERAAAAAPADVRVDAARAVLDWASAGPAATVERLRALAVGSDDPFMRMQVAVALLWSGDTAGAEQALRELRGTAPDDFYQEAADDLLHPGATPGYPPFLPASGAPLAVDVAQKAVDAAPADVRALVGLAAALQADGDRAGAARAYAQALATAPADVEAQVGQIVNGFDKDRPERAFGSLGPLVGKHPESPSPRFHLAMLLLWIGSRDKAGEELAIVARDFPDAPLGQIAAELGATGGAATAAATTAP